MAALGCDGCRARFGVFLRSRRCAECRRDLCHTCCQSLLLLPGHSVRQFVCDGCVQRSWQNSEALPQQEWQYESLLQFAEQLSEALRCKSRALDQALERQAAEATPPSVLCGHGWADPAGAVPPLELGSEGSASVGHPDSAATPGADPRLEDMSHVRAAGHRQDALRQRLQLERLQRERQAERMVSAAEREGLLRERQLLLSEVESLNDTVQALQSEKDFLQQKQQSDSTHLRELQSVNAAQARSLARKGSFSIHWTSPTHLTLQSHVSNIPVFRTSRGPRQLCPLLWPFFSVSRFPVTCSISPCSS
eukprot:EG_transcript_16408